MRITKKRGLVVAVALALLIAGTGALVAATHADGRYHSGLLYSMYAVGEVKSGIPPDIEEKWPSIKGEIAEDDYLHEHFSMGPAVAIYNVSLDGTITGPGETFPVYHDGRLEASAFVHKPDLFNWLRSPANKKLGNSTVVWARPWVPQLRDALDSCGAAAILYVEVLEPGGSEVARLEQWVVGIDGSWRFVPDPNDYPEDEAERIWTGDYEPDPPVWRDDVPLDGVKFSADWPTVKFKLDR